MINDPYDINYIGIGSAKNNDQQFPSFIESLLFTTNYLIRLINIDIEFEKNYLLLNYISNLEKVSDIEYKNNRISIIYINKKLIFDFVNNSPDLLYFDELNKIIMDQSNLLIVGNYIGHENQIFENYYENIYKNTKYEKLYEKLIVYDFTNDGIGGCNINLLENYPIIQNKKLIKIPQQISSLLSFSIKYSENYNIIYKLKKIFESIIFDIINQNNYIIRNLKNNNITPQLVDYHKKSNLKNVELNFENLSTFIFLFKEELLNIQSLLIFLYPLKFNYINDLNILYNSFNIIDMYEWHNQYTKTMKNILV